MFDNIDLDSFWDERSDKCAPPTDELIRSVEAELGYKLPESYIYLMKQRNGGKPKNHCFVTKDLKTLYLSQILSIGRDDYSLCGRFGSRFMINEWGYPDIGVTICHSASAGHEMFFLDYSECGRSGEPKVVYIEQEAGCRRTVLADSFEEFINGLGFLDIDSDPCTRTYFMKKTAEVYSGKLVVCKKGYEIAHCTKEVVIPEGVTVLDEEAFYEDKDIVRAVCPESLEIVGERAFSLCDELEEVILPKTMHGTLTETFSECYALRRVDIPRGITEIGEYAFGYCSELEEVTIPDTVKRIGESAFINCKSLKELYIPDSVEEINTVATIIFCDSLEKVRLPENVRFIHDDDCGYTLLMACGSLRELVVGDRSYAFYPDEVEPDEREWTDEEIKALLAIYCKGKKPYAVDDEVIERVRSQMQY